MHNYTNASCAPYPMLSLHLRTHFYSYATCDYLPSIYAMLCVNCAIALLMKGGLWPGRQGQRGKVRPSDEIIS